MKRLYTNSARVAKTMFFPLLLLTLAISCGEEKKEESKTEDEARMEMVMQDRDAKKEIMRLGDYEVEDSVQENGHKYVYKIVRAADDSLGIVVDTEGYQTVDNAITLNLKRDGATVFSRRFTRNAFKIGISDEDFSHYVLMNMVFDRITDAGAQFIVSVGEGSGDDMFVQFAMTVGMDGTTNIVPHEMFDEDEIGNVDLE